jgi:hypothetical protein
MVRPKRVAFRTRNGVGTRGLAFAAQWLAYALPYRRFVAVLADADARLGADVDRYSFIVVDLRHLLLAGLPAHFESYHPSHAVGSPRATCKPAQNGLREGTIVAQIQRAAELANENCDRAMKLAHKLAMELRAAEDRINQLEGEVQLVRDRAARAEHWQSIKRSRKSSSLRDHPPTPNKGRSLRPARTV